MQKFETFTGIVCPLDRSNVDTDAIIPKQFLKSIRRSGFGPHLFDQIAKFFQINIAFQRDNDPVSLIVYFMFHYCLA